MNKPSQDTRRAFLRAATGSTLATLAGGALAQAVDFKPSARYPDPSVQVLDPSFNKYRIYASSVEQLATGFRWAEGPVWFGDGRFLLLSDIPNNRIVRFDEASGQTSTFRANAGYSNGLARDRQGRLLVCEHLGRRITRTEYDGSTTVLADSFDGKPLNSPNDLAVSRDGSVWFTDPPFGIGGRYEGEKAKAEQPHGVYRIDGASGKLSRVLDDLPFPNGIAFTADEKQVYLIGRSQQGARLLVRYDVSVDGKLGNRVVVFDAGLTGTLDGIKCDEDGNIWAGWGSTSNAPGALSADMDGVVAINPAGKMIGHIHLPERCANLCFGGAKRNRLFMASCHSLYAVHVETRGA